MTTLAPSCSTILRISWMARSAVSLPQPTLTTSIGTPPAVAPVNPSVAVVRELDVAPASLIIANAAPAWTSSLKPPKAPSHSAMMPSLTPSPEAGASVPVGSIRRSRSIRCGGSVRCGGASVPRVRRLRQESASSSSLPQATATSASEMTAPQNLILVRDLLILGHSISPPSFCVSDESQLFEPRFDVRSRCVWQRFLQCVVRRRGRPARRACVSEPRCAPCR